ncbi:interferon-induced protein with tetratricopeptide repeats 5-like protein [Lates japonicus]|uniref:Interferon-induced protein with tetratricopeptide repeats 5-like protein n=1 Tax=Lates japonicus TaxID=270547 RepID=A0AAD3NKE7_LATJO|nr:interferon-induced protein with tetratricopeptide repeats 5-like protein [Lates japonicus]
MTILALKLGTYNKHQEAEDLIERALKTDPDNLMSPATRKIPLKLKLIAERRPQRYELGWAGLRLLGMVCAEDNKKEAMDLVRKPGSDENNDE